MTLKLNGSTSGSVSIDAPASTTDGVDVTLTLPVNDGDAGQVLKTDGSGNLSWFTPVTYGSVTAIGTGTEKDIATTSTDVIKYELFVNGLSVSGNNVWKIQIGDAGGIETSGYTVSSAYMGNSSAASNDFFTDGWTAWNLDAAAFVCDFKFTLTRYDGNKWYGQTTIQKTADDDGTMYWMHGFKELSAALTTIRIAAAGAFDGGNYKLITYK